MTGSPPSAGRKLLSEKTCFARMRHYCYREHPECADPHIMPGDRYTRELWVYWRPGHRWVVVKKYHDNPPCQPHPSYFDEEVTDLEEFDLESLPLAA